MQKTLNQTDSLFLAYVRGAAIITIVFLHLGGWVFRPYSHFALVVVPMFFFVSGATCYYSFLRSADVKNYGSSE